MKARQIQTRYWDDQFVVDATWQSRFVYLYLLTCQYVNLCGIFQLPDKKIIFETGLSDEDFDIAKEELSLNKKVLFYRGWVYVPNAFKNNRYWKSPKNWEAWEIEFSKINEEALDNFNTAMNTNIYTDQKTEINNQKKEVKEIKPEPISQKKERRYKDIVCTADDQTAEEILKDFKG